MVTSSVPHVAVLTHHPETPCLLVRQIDARVRWVEPERLCLAYTVCGDITLLRIPSTQSPRRVDGLWEHTCLEVFIAVQRQPTYYEFNFSPSGEWAAYAFKSYRDGGAIEDDGLHPKIVVRSAGNSFELEAIVRLDRLPLARPGASLRLGLSAVIEETNGAFSYWALKHPPGKPDFHHPDSFALELALSDQRA